MLYEVITHPSDPNLVLSNGICAYWRSVDRGRTWDLSITGMGGYSARDVHFNPADYREIDMAVADLDSLRHRRHAPIQPRSPR